MTPNDSYNYISSRLYQSREAYYKPKRGVPKDLEMILLRVLAVDPLVDANEPVVRVEAFYEDSKSYPWRFYAADIIEFFEPVAEAEALAILL